MTKWFASVVVAATMSVAAVGCSVDVARDLPEQTIPGDPAAHAAATQALAAGGAAPTTQFVTASPPIDGSIASRIALESLALDITPTAEPAGDADCWDFVQSVGVSIESTRQGSALPRVQIATGGAPGCVRAMDLAPVAGVNLKPYTDEGFRITVDTVGVPPADNVSFVTRVVLRAGVF
jgi:hypothetical protein